MANTYMLMATGNTALGLISASGYPSWPLLTVAGMGGWLLLLLLLLCALLTATPVPCCTFQSAYVYGVKGVLVCSILGTSCK